jgi:tRNA(Ile)-lysidine synthase
VLRRYRDDLYLSAPCSEVKAEETYHWQLSTPLNLTGVGKLSATPAIGQGLRVNELTVKFRQGGETVKIAGRPRRTLKNLLNEWGVLPWERDRLPLIYHGDELIGIVGYYYHSDWLAGENEQGWLVKFEA